MAIALSHGGTSIYSSSSASNQVLVGTVEGVLIMERDGKSWKVAHRGLTDKHIHALIVEPDSGTIFAGVQKGSVYASTDGGYTWEARGQGLTQNDIYTLSWSRHNGKVRIFAGTEPAHLFFSDDLGSNWKELTAMRSVDTSAWTFPAPPHIAHTKDITFHPSDPETMFIGIEQGGLLKSTDGGETFTVIKGMDDDVHRTAINPQKPERIYVTGGDGIYATSDGGNAWEHLTTKEDAVGGYPDTMVLHPRQPDTIFVGASRKGPSDWRKSHYAGSRLSKSTDGGRTWRTLTAGISDDLQSAFGALCLEDWGDGFSLFGATTAGEVWCSEDGGENWHQAVTGVPPVAKGEHHLFLTQA